MWGPPPPACGGRALASRAPKPLINVAFAEPLVRALSVDFFTRVVSGDLDPAEIDGDAFWGLSRMADMMAVPTKFFDQFCDCNEFGHPTGGDPGLRAGRARVPAAVAGRDDGL